VPDAIAFSFLFEVYSIKRIGRFVSSQPGDQYHGGQSLARTWPSAPRVVILDATSLIVTLRAILCIASK